MSDIEQQTEDKHLVLRNALYHKERQQWFEKVSRLFNFLVLLAGSSTVALLLNKHPELTAWSGMAVVIISSLQLIYDYAGQARTHQFLQMRFHEILSEIEAEGKYSDAKSRAFRAKAVTLFAEEPIVYKALQAVVENEATTSIWGGNEMRNHVRFHEHLFRNIFVFPGNTRFKERQEWIEEFAMLTGNGSDVRD